MGISHKMKTSMVDIILFSFKGQLNTPQIKQASINEAVNSQLSGDYTILSPQCPRPKPSWNSEFVNTDEAYLIQPTSR